jgi:hypothetical protein
MVQVEEAVLYLRLPYPCKAVELVVEVRRLVEAGTGGHRD